MKTIDCPKCGHECANDTGTMFHKPRCPGCGLVNPRKHITTNGDVVWKVIGFALWCYLMYYWFTFLGAAS